MGITTYIVDDLPRHYNRLESLFIDFPDFEVISKYEGLQPYDKTLELINEKKPQLILIDWDLEEKPKTGYKLFETINNFHCYVIFYSVWSDPEVVNYASSLVNATFFSKGAGEILPKEKLRETINNVIRPYFKDTLSVRLEYYANGLSGFGRDNIREKVWLCKNIICLMGNGKKYNFLYIENYKPILYTGGCDKAGDISDLILEAKHPDLKKFEKESHIIWYNNLHYSKRANSNKLFINDNLKDKKDNRQRMFWTI